MQTDRESLQELQDRRMPVDMVMTVDVGRRPAERRHEAIDLGGEFLASLV
jgi:hypothetical protein